MIEYVGICPIDWQQLINHLETQTPYVGPKHKAGDNIPGLNEVTDMWARANLGPTVQWDMFYPGDHFDNNLVKQFAEWAGLESYTNAWVSRVHPGFCAPQHWDVQDDEPLPDTIRFHVHMGQPQFGHILIVGDQCFYNQAQGASYKWPSRKAWHAGANCGLVPKYIFNIW